MKNIRYLSVQFDQCLQHDELRFFRSAVIEKTERKSDLFHNHLAGEQKVIYRYPLIQYKLLDGGHAGIVCLEEGTEDIHQLFQAQKLDLRIGNKQQTFKVVDMQLRYYQLALTDPPLEYRISNYLPFTQERYARWQALAGQEEARKELLAATLRGNILTFAKGLEWWIDGRLEVDFQQISPARVVRFKEQQLLAFDLNFTTNVNLPPWIGLGKGVSIGHGTVTPINQ
ncbi:CRISPR-associated endonuclease Cas6 [Neolewinella lacunae]|uniref:Uncharacterized protein n=1 Tax=Neolewinella lacunae TaxID=1517758 RepID=A0A923PR72_9BACT|nr:CRISPR-associated endonuclease Cas6 [Neolewinella lacunae]MBC6995242.1 hypothetical protein [Neolewinella lacunae]MDN3635449.1 CRISPR-associated endonuclease Cas6 [Neolewinella lacunae]